MAYTLKTCETASKCSSNIPQLNNDENQSFKIFLQSSLSFQMYNTVMWEKSIILNTTDCDIYNLFSLHIFPWDTQWKKINTQIIALQKC